MKPFCFLSPEVHRSWKKGRLASVIFPTVLIVHWCLCLSCDLEVWSTNLMFAVWIGISSSGGRLNWYRQCVLLWVILITEYIVSDLGRLMIRWHSAMVKRWQGSPRSPQSSPQSVCTCSGSSCCKHSRGSSVPRLVCMQTHYYLEWGQWLLCHLPFSVV